MTGSPLKSIRRRVAQRSSRESERLRNALLDSVAHELRTPLTSITAAITSLRSDDRLSKEQSGEMMQVIEEEAARLDRLVGQGAERPGSGAVFAGVLHRLQRARFVGWALLDHRRLAGRKRLCIRAAVDRLGRC